MQFTKTDPRESFPPYDTCTTFESALAKDGIYSEEYAAADKRLARSRILIHEQMQKYAVHAIVVPTGCYGNLCNANYPQITVPMGYTEPSTEVVVAEFPSRHGTAVDSPVPQLMTHPNK